MRTRAPAYFSHRQQVSLFLKFQFGQLTWGCHKWRMCSAVSKNQQFYSTSPLQCFPTHLSPNFVSNPPIIHISCNRCFKVSFWLVLVHVSWTKQNIGPLNPGTKIVEATDLAYIRHVRVEWWRFGNNADSSLSYFVFNTIFQMFFFCFSTVFVLYPVMLHQIELCS